jgi:hypothetical protein
VSGRLVGALVLATVCGSAEAQVSRVFVSVLGNDANVCSDVATPCRTFAGGITQVDPQGEVIVIASGSYAGGTITKSVKINVASGVVAFSGLPITVDPGAGGTVVIRGLTLKDATAGLATGITQQSGTLFVENTVVDGWNDGLVVASGAEQIFVKRSVFRNQLVNGIEVAVGSLAVVAVDGSYFLNNNAGITAIGGRGRVSDSVFSGNDVGAEATGANTVLTLQRCEISDNEFWGLLAGSGSTLRVSRSTIVRNGIGLDNYNDTATVESFGNNVIRGNVGGNNVSGTVATVSLQ